MIPHTQLLIAATHARDALMAARPTLADLRCCYCSGRIVGAYHSVTIGGKVAHPACAVRP
jgi:hypothetical protein